MSFSRPIQWYHSHADPIWPDGTFKNGVFHVDEIKHIFANILQEVISFQQADRCSNFCICSAILEFHPFMASRKEFMIIFFYLPYSSD